MASLFALGVPFTAEIDGFSPYGPYQPQQNPTPQYSLAGAYGSSEIVWYQDIRDPNTLDFTPAPPVATNPVGAPLVVAYDRMTWGYTKLRPDEWYYLRFVYRLSRRGNAGAVRVRFPQPSGLVECSALFEQISASTRVPGVFTGIGLVFSQLARVDRQTNIPAPAMVWLPFVS